MKTNIHFLSYLANFFLECGMLQTKVVGKIKTHILCLMTPPPTRTHVNHAACENIEKYCRAGQVMHDIIIRRERKMWVDCRITNACIQTLLLLLQLYNSL